MTKADTLSPQPRPLTRSALNDLAMMCVAHVTMPSRAPKCVTSLKFADRNPAILASGCQMSSIGKSSATVMMLKKSCIVAAAKALRNRPRRPTKPMATRTAVIVVPILAPITTGTASSTCNWPDATSATTMLVVIEEL